MFPVKKRKLIEKQKYVHAAEDVSFEVYPGEVLGIVGESGSGKSTLARTILALTPSTSGQVFYQGEDITDFKVSAGEKRRLRSEIQMIFQDPYASLNPKIKIGNAIAEPMLLHGQASSYAEAKEKIQHLLEVVGLQPAVFDRYPHEFSGGQRQRIGIVRALAVNPKLIFCDESVSALDVSVQAQILNLFQSLKEQFHLTYVFIGHDLAVVRYISDRVMVMYLGKVMEIAPYSELTGDNIDHVGFGVDCMYGDHVGLHHAFAAALSTGDTSKTTVPYQEVPFVKYLENPTEASWNIPRWLIKHGYTDEEIIKVLGGNAIRVLREVWS